MKPECSSLVELIEKMYDSEKRKYEEILQEKVEAEAANRNPGVLYRDGVKNEIIIRQCEKELNELMFFIRTYDKILAAINGGI